VLNLSTNFSHLVTRRIFRFYTDDLFPKPYQSTDKLIVDDPTKHDNFFGELFAQKRGNIFLAALEKQLKGDSINKQVFLVGLIDQAKGTIQGVMFGYEIGRFSAIDARDSKGIRLKTFRLRIDF